jgi:hypothetical protein
MMFDFHEGHEGPSDDIFFVSNVFSHKFQTTDYTDGHG